MKTTNVNDMSDDDLKQELARRAQARDEADQKAHEEYRVRVVTTLTLEAINTLAPTHGRTSCNDQNKGNGWGSSEYGARCVRCALLDTLRDGWIPYPRRFHVEIS